MKTTLHILSFVLISFSSVSMDAPIWAYTPDTTDGVPISKSHPLYVQVNHIVDSMMRTTTKNYVGVLKISFTIDTTQQIDNITQIKFVHPDLDNVFYSAVKNAKPELFKELQHSKLYAISITINHKKSSYEFARILYADCNYKKAVKVLQKLYNEFPESSDILFLLARSMICSKHEAEGLVLMKSASEKGDCDAIRYLKNQKGCC